MQEEGLTHDDDDDDATRQWELKRRTDALLNDMLSVNSSEWKEDEPDDEENACERRRWMYVAPRTSNDDSLIQMRSFLPPDTICTHELHKRLVSRDEYLRELLRKANDPGMPGKLKVDMKVAKNKAKKKM